MELYQRVEATSYLGREFLTWLWFRGDSNDGQFEVNGETIAVWFDAKLKLSSTGTLKEESVIKSDRPTDTEEARVSLRSGKQVDEAKLSLSIGPKIWSMTVKSSDLSLHGMKLPALLGTTDEDCVYERLALLEECQDTFDGLFRSFVALRLDDSLWGSEIEAMRLWVQSELED